MKNLFIALTLVLTSCSSYFEEEVKPFTQQEIKEFNNIKAKSALKQGSFHMQPVSSTSSVRISNKIRLKKPNLPAFDVVYVKTNLEDILLELANSSGETVVIPQSIRGRKITLSHSGGDFKDMLDLILPKAGYSYNYIDGIWNITRYPIRTYQLEIGQSERTGSLDTSAISSSEGDSSSSSSSSDDEDSELETTYEDKVWTEVDEVLEEMVKYGHFVSTRKEAAVSEKAVETSNGNLDNNFSIIDESNSQETSSKKKSFNDSEVTVDDDNIEPWYKVTKSAGLITVRSAPEAHRQIEKFLETTQESLHRQIFAEVRVVAITESKDTNRGVSWSIDGILNAGFSPTNAITQPGVSGGFLKFSNSNQGLDGIIQNMADISDLHVISTPQMLIRNNQLGYVKVVNQLAYITTETETTSTDTSTLTNRTDTVNNKDVGTILSIMPYIGKNKVQVRLRLSVSQQSGSITTQSSVANSDPVTNEVPIVSNNVIDQDMIIDFGRVYALGGYIEENRNMSENYIPGFNQIPGFSELMRRSKNTGAKTRFIVFMKINRA